MRDREFDSDGLRPADAGYGKPQSNVIDSRRGKRIRKVLRTSRNLSASRQKSRRGLGRRKYR